MSTYRVLTDEQLVAASVEPFATKCLTGQGPGDLMAGLQAVEQTVLQSPEIQALRKDAERFEFLRDNAQLFSHFGEAGNSGWCVMRRDSAITRVFTYNGQELVEAIDAAMEK